MCKHCGPAIAAYKDCDVAPSPDPEEEPSQGELSLGHKSGANLNVASLLVVTAAVMIM